MHGRGMGLVPTGPKNVVDKVDDLLMGDVATTSSGALLTVLQEGACDVLDAALWRHKLGAPWHFQVGPCPAPYGTPTRPPGSKLGFQGELVAALGALPPNNPRGPISKEDVGGSTGKPSAT